MQSFGTLLFIGLIIFLNYQKVHGTTCYYYSTYGYYSSLSCPRSYQTSSYRYCCGTDSNKYCCTYSQKYGSSSSYYSYNYSTTYDDVTINYALIIGCVVGGIIFLTMVGGCICWLCYYLNRKTGRVIQPAPYNTGVIALTQQQQQAQPQTTEPVATYNQPQLGNQAGAAQPSNYPPPGPSHYPPGAPSTFPPSYVQTTKHNPSGKSADPAGSLPGTTE